MTKTTRQVVAGLALTCLAGAARPAEAVEDARPEIQRVRSSNPLIATLISQIVQQSKTFRDLIDAVNATDGFVYFEEGKCGHGVRVCLVKVTMAGSKRILWVKVDTRKADWPLLASSIGHELRHTLEVLGDRNVTDNASLYMFYLHGLGLGVGTTGTQGTFETRAAIEAGDAILSEVRNYGSGRIAPLAR
jgi:hypothetical protein